MGRPWQACQNLEMVKRDKIYAIYATVYNPDSMYRNLPHLSIEKINSHVVILNFSMEIQSIDASILVAGTTWIRI
jgi:hypothetical protein